MKELRTIRSQIIVALLQENKTSVFQFIFFNLSQTTRFD